ncbi:3-oxoadipate enol-lactonase [Arsenicitalea aurantiaca]|nr:3-oxoadipate enol-lactonase [Arsenicitalea aurantiaca]
MDISPLTRHTVAGPEGNALAASSMGSRQGLPILFGNSLAADMSMWDEVAERLQAERLIVRYDMRGHGASEIVAEGTTLEGLGRDALAVMDALGLERVVYCGLSLGGLVGMWLALNAPERLAGLVLANTAASFPPASMWEDRAAAARRDGVSSLVAPTLERWLTPAFREANPERSEDIARMIGATPGAGYAACCGVLASADVSGRLGEIALPVLVIAGDTDPSTPPARAEELHRAIAGSELVTLSAAHLSAVEAADDMADALRRFAARI